MFRFSAGTEYALRAVMRVAQSKNPLFIREIAEQEGIPQSFLSKIIQSLVRVGLLDARRGMHGGVTLARPKEAISLLDIIEACEGSLRSPTCLLNHTAQCPKSSGCPVHKVWQKAQERMTKVLIETKLSHLLSFVVLIGVLLANVSCKGPTDLKQTTAKPSITPALFESGKRLYEKQCAVCHGPRGVGDGPAAYLLYPKPRDFTREEYRLVSSDVMRVTDEDLLRTVTRGMPGSAMPSWEALTPEKRWALVYYVRYLEELGEQLASGEVTEEQLKAGLPWPTVEKMVTTHAALGSIAVPVEPSVTPESLVRGKAIYAQACAACHGPQGKGDGQQIMKDNLGYPIKPRDLTAGVFKGSSESKELYYRIIAGLPGSPMPSYAGVFTDEELWDLIHYIQSLVPPGVEERVRLHHQTVRARRVRGDLPFEPSSEKWKSIKPVYVAVTPLWWRDRRIEGVEVKTLHNGKELAIHLAWSDPTQDNSLVKSQTFSDGVAVQFSTDKDPPFFGMGDSQAAVEIWHWKAAWQEDSKGWRDVETVYPDAAVDWYPGQRDYRHGDSFEVSQAKTASQEPLFMSGQGADNPLSDLKRGSAEEVAAKGLGTLTSHPPLQQHVEARGEWHGGRPSTGSGLSRAAVEGRWQVVLRRKLAFPEEDEDLQLRPGQKVSVAFAVWDGAANDRNGQKSVSIWNTLTLER